MTALPTDLTLRAARDTDGDALRAVLAAVFAEYPGCLFVRDELPELEAPATYFREHGGALWVLEHEGEVRGCIGTTPAESALWELKKLYLLPVLRGRRVSRVLIETVESHAVERGARAMHLWTDTRFETAHRVYERCGYVRLADTRELHDASFTVEYHYRKALDAPAR